MNCKEKKINILIFFLFIFLLSGCDIHKEKTTSVRRSTKKNTIRIFPKTTIIPEDVVEQNLTFYQNIPFVEVNINGKGPFKFCIDTGASGLFVSNELAVKLGLKISSLRVDIILNTPSGKVNLGRPLEVGQVSIGDAKFVGNYAAHVQRDVFKGLNLNTDFDGILGLGVFKDCLLEIDYIDQNLKIYNLELARNTLSKNSLPIIMKNGTIYIKGEVADKIMEFQLDTGNCYGISISKKYEKEINLQELKKTNTMATLKDRVEVLVYGFDGNVTFGNTVFQNPDIYVHSINLMGGDILKNCVLRINQNAGYVDIEQK